MGGLFSSTAGAAARSLTSGLVSSGAQAARGVVSAGAQAARQQLTRRVGMVPYARSYTGPVASYSGYPPGYPAARGVLSAGAKAAGQQAGRRIGHQLTRRVGMVPYARPYNGPVASYSGYPPGYTGPVASYSGYPPGYPAAMTGGARKKVKAGRKAKKSRVVKKSAAAGRK